MEVLQMLHDSKINGSIEWLFDGVWEVKIGDGDGTKAIGWVRTAAEAEAWLHFKARELYPASDYAKATEPQ